MKKIYLLLLCILTSSAYYSQSQDANTGVTQPVPTAASLTSYNNTPVSVQTGIPDISYPMISLPTNNKFVNIGLGLNYHAGNTSNDSWTSNVGKGWSLLGSSMISREIIGDFDEKNSNENGVGNRKNEFNDIYNFSTPEESGRFRIKRDTLNNTFEIVKLTPYTSKIVYQRSSNMATLIINSFTVTSNTGIHYEFQDYDVSTMNVRAYNPPNTGTVFVDLTYKSAFYLTSILDENNKELVKYNYLKDITYVIGHPTIVESENNRLSSIEIKDRGIATINYSKHEGLDKKNDKFGIDNITLKTANNLFVKKYVFEYTYPAYRNLHSFSQIDSKENVIEKYVFEYKEISSPFLESGIIFSNVLNRVLLPTGGTIEYNFDLVPYYYYDVIKTIPNPGVAYGDATFQNANNDGKKYFFTVNEQKEITIDASEVGVLFGRNWGINFYIKVGNTFQLKSIYSLGVIVGATDPDYDLVQIRNFEPGEYYVELFCDGMINLARPIIIHALDKTGPPTTEHIKTAYKYGIPRIKNIKYFDLPSSSINYLSTPSRIEEYDYAKFDNPTESSEYFVDGGSAGTDKMDPAAPSLIYKNVKVSQGNNTGYTKYYFRTPEGDAPTIGQNGNFWPNYNLTRGGLLEKTEMYNTANQKLSESIFDYTIQDFDGPEYKMTGGAFGLKTVWTKEEKVTSRNYFGSGFNESKKEVIKNSNNYAPNLERVTSSDGSIQETTYQYALDKSNQKLINANIIGIPLETTTIRKKNTSDAGKLISKTEKKYDNPLNNYPASVVSFDARTNNMVTEANFNRYDSKGNLLQYTTKEGTPVAVVWGYGGTLSIAKVEGATYDQISGYISDIVSKSDADIDATSEQALVNALDIFRNLPALQNTQITTYVFDPLIGMKIMTPPAGIREYYKYDTAGRLEQVVDENGKLLRKNKYNYKH